MLRRSFSVRRPGPRWRWQQEEQLQGARACARVLTLGSPLVKAGGNESGTGGALRQINAPKEVLHFNVNSLLHDVFLYWDVNPRHARAGTAFIVPPPSHFHSKPPSELLLGHYNVRPAKQIEGRMRSGARGDSKAQPPASEKRWSAESLDAFNLLDNAVWVRPCSVQASAVDIVRRCSILKIAACGGPTMLQ